MVIYYLFCINRFKYMPFPELSTNIFPVNRFWSEKPEQRSNLRLLRIYGGDKINRFC